eukprot:2414989-Alexandrium_andersonii.AAC.1
MSRCPQTPIASLPALPPHGGSTLQYCIRWPNIPIAAAAAAAADGTHFCAQRTMRNSAIVI